MVLLLLARFSLTSTYAELNFLPSLKQPSVEFSAFDPSESHQDF
jgi:hypothetical protein